MKNQPVVPFENRMGESSTATRPRLGFFGGTFDPPHLGHVTLARLAMEHAKLDKLLLCPAHHAPLREEPPLFSGKERLGMVQSICMVNRGMEACPIEVNHGRVRYTYETILEIKELYPCYDIFLLLGADQFSRLHLWRNTGELINLVHFLIFNRECSTTEPASLKGIQVTFMNNSLIDLSSTKIRQELRSGNSSQSYLPQEVFKYLQENDLFPITN